MEGHLSYHRNYMAYPNKINTKISIDMCKLRDSIVSSNRIYMLSRHVNQCKNKNTAFPFTQKSYEYVVNPDNFSITINLLQFVQNSSFFLSYLQENPDVLATITFSIRKQWQYIYMINCIIPSFFGFFSCHEYAQYAVGFYSEIINKTNNPSVSIQIIRPFFHSAITHHFFKNAFGTFIRSVMIDENIIKNPDKQVTVYANLFGDCLMSSIQYLPSEFFSLLNEIKSKNWAFKHKKSLIIDNFIFPELKIWTNRMCLNTELKNFIFRIMDMISISSNISYGDTDSNEQKLQNLSSTPSLFKSMHYMTDSSSSFNLMALSLEPEVQASPLVPISRSTSTLKPPRFRSTKISDESKATIILISNFINLLFNNPNQDSSIYQMPVLYENFSDEIFSQCTQFILNVYDVRFVSRLLERCHLFPNKIASSGFLHESFESYEAGIFCSHVYSHHIIPQPISYQISLFSNTEELDVEKGKKSKKFNISLIDNDLFLHFLSINKHYASIFNRILGDFQKSYITDQNEIIEKHITYLTLMNEIKSENDRILYQSSFELIPFTEQILSDIKNKSDSNKKKSYIKLFNRASNIFNPARLIEAKKILYLKLLDSLYKELIGDYWHVLCDFDRFWEELINEPKEKKNLSQTFSSMNSNFQVFYINSTKLLSQIDQKPMSIKYYIIFYSFSLLNHIAQRVQNGNEIYYFAFQHIKSKELLSSFLIIDSMAIQVDIFKELCTDAELTCWNTMKKSIENYINRDEQCKKVYTSITEYLIAVSPTLLYNVI